MTKAVRIENADTNTSVEVVVQVFDMRPDGNDHLVQEIVLGHPTAMTGQFNPDVYLTSARYLKVIERPKS